MNNLKKELSQQWNKPKSRNLNHMDEREARDYGKIESLQESINAKKAQDENSVQAKRAFRKKEVGVAKVSFLKSLFGKKKVMQVKALTRREKRNKE